ncbi:AraC family transcriptional regulator [Nonomuraea sp. NPDC050310]|uniref:helix-turn-helix domain-containing protein n=1 Tax=Nonomuraea sp. NPDC050310 TaxID=3154935 RepID=UPI0033C9E69C
MAAVAHYLTPPTEVLALGLAVTGVGWITGQRASQTGRVLTGYAGVFVTEGSGRVALRGRPGQPVTAGSFFWLPPGIPHTYGPGPSGWSERWVLFEGPAAGRYEDLGYLGGGPALVVPVDRRETEAAFDRLLDLAGQPDTLARHVSGVAALHTLITTVGIETYPGSAASAGLSVLSHTRRDIGRRALEILARDAARPVSMAAVARELSVSRDTLATAVRRLTGSTPTDYLTRLRLDRAKSLLAGTDLPIAQVAGAVGYPDPSYFTRAFTRWTGVTPTAFRRQQTL